jgi:predicted transglutaminase-like cysteine proteinase
MSLSSVMGRQRGGNMTTRSIQVFAAFLAVFTIAGTPLYATGNGSRFSVATNIKFTRELGATLPPKGWVKFCARNPNDCAGELGQRLTVKLDGERWSELTGINAYVNHTIEPATDLELYKTEELWTIPQTRGDCEDYVLLKRQHLLDLGWPREALLITVVLDAQKAGHAVLNVMTDQGEFVLDNQDPRILHWTQTQYQFVKRQGQIHPDRWVALDPIASGIRRYTSTERRMGRGR